MKKIDQEEVSRRRGIYFQSFGIYGGASGFYDYGPYGSRIKDKIIRIWKELMLSEGNVAEYDGTSITHPDVLKVSGHYDRFFDYLVKCQNCNAKYKADDLIEKTGTEVTLEKDWLESKINELDIKCEKCGGKLGNVTVQKLMFQVDQGEGLEPFYLRPETAQGIFINFKEYYRFFREKLPFAIIQIGRGYRNEISPRRALYRLRELNMMECESFFDPDNEIWIKDPDDSYQVTYLASNGEETLATAKRAYEARLVKSQPMAYFMGVALRFYTRVGIDITRLRFRQHRKEERSHYSSETWDAEALTDLGWIEITGISHRGTYDISNHIKYSGKDIYAQRSVSKKEIIQTKREIDYEKVKTKMGSNSGTVINAIKEGKESIRIGMDILDLTEFSRVVEEKLVVDRENFVPVVIEPSFGIDRIIYTILDHNLSVREESGYNYLRIPTEISPYEVAILPLMDKEELDSRAAQVFRTLLQVGMEVIYDESGSIGKRYSRYDEVGITYCVTVDYESLSDGGVTLRHRDTKEQIRIKETDIKKHIREKPWNGRIS